MKDLKVEMFAIDRLTNRLRPLAWLFVGLSFLFAIYPLIWFDIKALKYNEYGDYVGGPVAAFLTLGSMFFIYITYLSQRYQVLLQQNEIRENLNQNYSSQFEARFFQLLHLHASNVSLMDYRNRKGEVLSVGRDCFRTYYKKFEKAILRVRKREFRKLYSLSNDVVLNLSEYESIEIALEDVLDEFTFVYTKFQSDLDPYYRSMEHLIGYTHQSELQEKQKEEFFEILRAQLSTYELVFVYYFIHLGGEFSGRQLSKLAKSYNLVRDVDEVDLFHGDKRIRF
ncbi:hypothetical protein KK062_29620 [Fulvivirgaceae bacterium PWU5]|uniref:Phage abortive infection protein n=1 Tax=Dawidia cretensis TaxID=2782350 RepID=A0AAP2GX83_9BACT|nr:putative phage abortive infection protein [Dawidia cretensis]MBT1712437.1 hypothetical protein [Dawidia cretensis]